MAGKIERYRFSDLDAMDKAVMKAFSSRENEAVYYEKGLIVSFMPTGSTFFDETVRACFAAYGGKEITDSNKVPSDGNTSATVSSK